MGCSVGWCEVCPQIPSSLSLESFRGRMLFSWLDSSKSIGLAFQGRSRHQTRWRSAYFHSCALRRIWCRPAGKTRWYPSTLLQGYTFRETPSLGICRPASRRESRISGCVLNCRALHFLGQIFPCFDDKHCKTSLSCFLLRTPDYYTSDTAPYSTKTEPKGG